jgi:photosystem II stability/assembly factor-like uncharacterized protein
VWGFIVVRWAVGAGGWMMRTFNSGVSWAQEGAGQTLNALRGIHIPQAAHVWLVGDANTVMRSYTDGRKWGVTVTTTYCCRRLQSQLPV